MTASQRTDSIDPAILDQPLRIGTRRSKLALWQANHIKDALRARWGDRLDVQLVEIVTEGDKILDRPLNQVGGKGLFVNGIEEQLLDNRVDLAVHSMKDLPGHLPEPLVIACTPVREDPRDALCGPEGSKLAKLPAGTRLGTSSLRRAALARRINPVLEIVPLRGNVPTRLAKLDTDEVDVVMLAASGLRRLGLDDQICEYLEVDRFCPAACQGILALECRRDDARVQTLVEPLHDYATGVAAKAERAFLSRLDGGCQVPMGCYAELRTDDVVTVNGVICDPAGRPCFIATKVGTPAGIEAVAVDLAENLLKLGARRVLASLTGRAKVA